MAEIFVFAFDREKQMCCSLWNQNLTNLTETASTAVVQSKHAFVWHMARSVCARCARPLRCSYQSLGKHSTVMSFFCNTCKRM